MPGPSGYEEQTKHPSPTGQVGGLTDPVALPIDRAMGADAPSSAIAQVALLVLNDALLGARLGVSLSRFGLRPIVVNTAKAALQVNQLDPAGLLVVQDQLDDGSGVDLCDTIRQAAGERAAPAVVIADEADSQRIVHALRHGVDDYITGVHDDDTVLLARIEALLQRHKPAPPVPDEQTDAERTITVGDITIRPWAFNVVVNGKRIDLTVTQFRLLLMLARKPGHIVRPEQIQDYLTERGSNLRETSVKSHVYFLRRKLGEAGKQIENVRRVGYRLRES